MKLTLKLLVVMFILAGCSNDEKEIDICSDSQYTCIPDSNFEQALIDLGYDRDGLNGGVWTSRISGITQLNLGEKSIADLSGIEDFVSLTILSIDFNELSSLNLSKNKSLVEFYCFNNQLKSIDISNNLSLSRLYCSENQLTSLDVSHNYALTYFDSQNNPLTCIVVNQSQLNNIPSNWVKDPEDTYALVCD